MKSRRRVVVCEYDGTPIPEGKPCPKCEREIWKHLKRCPTCRAIYEACDRDDFRVLVLA